MAEEKEKKVKIRILDKKGLWYEGELRTPDKPFEMDLASYESISEKITTKDGVKQFAVNHEVIK